MNYILIYVINLATALIGCQAHPLKGMHNSSAGREATEGFSSQARRRERRRENGVGNGEELAKEGQLAGLEGRGEKGRGIIFPIPCWPLSV